MSLINEALRKARLEAARQGDSNQEIVYPIGGGTSRGGPPALVVGLGIAGLIVAGAFLYWLGTRAAEDREVATAGATSAETAAGPAPAVGAHPLGLTDVSTGGPAASGAPAEAHAEEPMPGSAGTARTAGEPASSEPDSSASSIRSTPSTDSTTARRNQPAREPTSTQRPPSTDRPRPAAPAPAVTAAASTAATSDSQPASRQPAAEPTDETGTESGSQIDPEIAADSASEPEARADDSQTFVGEAEVPGVGSVRLGGIAFSGDQPFALINERVVGPGDRILGLLIAAVERDQVKLRSDDGTTYTLKLR